MPRLLCIDASAFGWGLMVHGIRISLVNDNSDNYVGVHLCRVASLFPHRLICLRWWVVGVVLFFNGEFDPGSGRTLAACLTHASRAVRPFRGYTSGERVSNT